MQTKAVTLTAVPGVPLIAPGDDLCAILLDALSRAQIVLRDHDVLVIAQKIVSKAEGRYLRLGDLTPSPRALELAALVDKDPRLVEAILSETKEVVRYRKDVLIVEHRLGFIMANAGVDQSNIRHPNGEEHALLLPADPDESCLALKQRIDGACAVDVAIIINDSFGRPWRNGVVGVALGAAGLPALDDLVGTPDLFGRAMRVTQVAFADEIAAAASLVMGQADEGLPLVHVRGLAWTASPVSAAALLRPREQDLFR